MAKAPDLPEIRVNLALAYFKLKRTADAVAQLEKAAALAPNDHARAVPARRRLRRDAGARQGGGGVREGARASAGRQRPAGLGGGRRRSARCISRRATPTRPTAQFEKALAAKPGAPAPTLGLAKVYFSKGDVAKALELFEQVVAAHARARPRPQQARGVHQGARRKGQAVSRRCRYASSLLSLPRWRCSSRSARSGCSRRRRAGSNETGPVRSGGRLAAELLRRGPHHRIDRRHLGRVARPRLHLPAAAACRSSRTAAAAPPTASSPSATPRATTCRSRTPTRHPRWDHVLNIVNRNGKLVESWEQHNKLFVRPHRVLINPYDPEKHVWLVDDGAHAIYKFTNDGKKLVMTLGDARGAGQRRDALQPADRHRLAARRHVLRQRRLRQHARREVRQERQVPA